MSNTMNTPPKIRWQLLSTVSAFALMTSVYGASEAQAAGSDADRPLVWIELGGQLENVSGQGEVFAPAFLAANPASDVLQKVTPLQAQRPPKFTFGGEGKISFQPESSDWVFAASVRFGRAGDLRQVHHQTYGTFFASYKYSAVPSGENIRGIDKFADTQARRDENHTILDFSAGKDVGLGMFGTDSSSVLSLGVRFAQFASKSAFAIRARPNLQFKDIALPTFHISFHFPYFHTYHATGHSSRSFDGIGPSLSWNGSAPFAGNPRDGEITFDWGANAALLFGRQKARVHHQESAHYVTAPGFFLRGGYYLAYPAVPHDRNNSRSVAVPNAGGFMGLSYRYEDAKISFGYRADFFFGAFDGGIDARKSEALGFKGPFASISVGLGD